MSAFKDQITKDLDTFFNPDEFMEEHTIDGEPVHVVFGNDELRDRVDKSGLDLGEILIFVRVDELKVKPVTGRLLRFDGKIMEIASVFEDSGVYEITLTQNRSA